jgi:hypothetical protein
MTIRRAILLGFLASGVACFGPSLGPPIQAYTKAVDDVAVAGSEDIDRCEHAVAEADRKTFCDRAKKHFDTIKSSADTLASQSGQDKTAGAATSSR